MLCASALVVSKMRWYTSLCVVGIFLLFLRDGVLLTMPLYLLCYYTYYATTMLPYASTALPTVRHDRPCSSMILHDPP